MNLIFPMSTQQWYHNYSVATCKNSHAFTASTLEDPPWVTFVHLTPALSCWSISVISRCWSLTILFNGSSIGKMARANDGTKRRSSVNIISVDVGTTTIACHHFDRSGISLYHTTRKVSVEPHLFNLLHDRSLRARVCSYIVKTSSYTLAITNSILSLLRFLLLWSCQWRKMSVSEWTESLHVHAKQFPSS